MLKDIRLIACTILAIGLPSSFVAAQEQPPLPPPVERREVPPPTQVVDEELEAIKAALYGTWKTQSDEYNAEADEMGGTIWMSFAPITVAGLTDAVYVERAWDTQKHHPFGQNIFQLYRFEDGIRMRTLDFRRGYDRSSVFAGLFMAPEVFPVPHVDELIATLDFVVEASAAGITAKTPHPYPTAVGGACQLVSEFTVVGDTIRSVDRGIATDGSDAWVSNNGKGYEWTRADMGLRVRKDDDGFIMIEYSGWDSEPGQLGDQAFIDHYGQTGDSMMFMSSAQSQSLAQLTIPIPEMPYEGLNRTLSDIRAGSVRRTYVPPELGLGDVQMGTVPPNSALYFMIDCVNYEKGELAPDREGPDAPGGEQPVGEEGGEPPTVEGGGEEGGGGTEGGGGG